MIRTATYIFLFGALLLDPARLHGQWIQTHGPYDTFVTCFAVCDSAIFVANNAATFNRSIDSGRTWTTHVVARSANLLSLAAIGAYVIAGVEWGLLRSSDGGATWTTVLANAGGHPEYNVYSLAVSDSNILAGVDIGVGTGEIFLSTDAGASWTNVSRGVNFGKVSAFAIETNGIGGKQVFACSDRGVYLSTNTGASWSQINNGLKDRHVTSLAILGTRVFAGTRGGVFESSNSGTTWASTSLGLTSKLVSSLSVSGSNLFLGTWDQGVFLSADSGKSWTSISNGLYSNCVNALGCIGNNLLAGFMDGTVCRSTDFGTSWSTVISGSIRISSSQLLAAIGNTVLGNTQFYLYTASPDGMDWIPTLHGPSLFASRDSIVYTISDSGACVSTDWGMSWTTAPNGGFPTSGLAVALAALGTNLFLGTSPVVDIDTNEGIYASRDNGASWHVVLKNRSLAGLVANESSIYAILGGNLWVSLDSGATWQMFNLPPPPPPANTPYVFAVAFRDSEIFVGTSVGVLRSNSGGKLWVYANSELPGIVSCFAVHERDVFAGTTAGACLLSKADTSWIAVNSGLPSTSNSITAIVASNSDVYVAAGSTFWKRPVSEMVTEIAPSIIGSPKMYSLCQNYPNPFNPTTNIVYTIPRQGMVFLTVYDLLGRKISALVSTVQPAGSYKVKFDASKLASGVYFYRLQAGSFVQTRKLILLR